MWRAWLLLGHGPLPLVPCSQQSARFNGFIPQRISASFFFRSFQVVFFIIRLAVNSVIFFLKGTQELFTEFLGGGFKYLYYFHPYFGKDSQFDFRIFFKWVGSTTNQI